MARALRATVRSDARPDSRKARAARDRPLQRVVRQTASLISFGALVRKLAKKFVFLDPDNATGSVVTAGSNAA